MSWLRESPALTWLPVVGGAAELAIAGRYFFRRPFIGVAIATACFLVAALVLRARHAFAESAQIKRISGGADVQQRAGK